MEHTVWTIPLLAAAEGGGSMMQSILLIWVPIGFLFWFLLLRPQQQERKRREAMLAALRKNDRIVTGGGIHGVVTSVDREGDEGPIVTIKVDESANVRLRVSLGYIVHVKRKDESSHDSSAK